MSFLARSVAVLLVSLVPLAAQPAYRLEGIAFGPYADGQAPGHIFTYAEIQQRLLPIAPYVKAIRTYGCLDGLHYAAAIAKGLGLKVSLGVALGYGRDAEEMACAIAEANAGNVDTLIIGNETLLRFLQEGAACCDAPTIVNYMNAVRGAVPATVKITTAEGYGLLLANPSLIAASDEVYYHYHGFWESRPVEYAISGLELAHQKLVAVAGGRPVIPAETGWPSDGQIRGAAIPSPTNAARYFLHFVSWARAKNLPYFVFSTYDEAWKANTNELAAGGHWGLWTSTGVLKPGMQQVFDNTTLPTLPGGAGSPALSMTFISPAGDSRDLHGRLLHVNPRTVYAAVAIRVFGAWWSKPYDFQLKTPLEGTGDFTTDFTTGGFDSMADRVRVYIYPNSIAPPYVANAGSPPDPAATQAITFLEVSRGASGVCGKIQTAAGTAVPGVIVTRSTGGTAESIYNGDYCFADLPAGSSFVLTPTLANTTFAPPTATVSSLSGIANADFTATLPQNLPPPAPASPTPANGATNVALAGLTLSVPAVATASSYSFDFGTANPPPFAASGAAPSYSPTSLSPGLTYYWRATATNGFGSTPSPVWWFTTAPCAYQVNPTSSAPGAAATSITVSVSTQAGCPWAASSAAGWLTPNLANASGSGSVEISVQANGGAQRIGVVTVAGQAVTVTQAAPVAAPPHNVSPNAGSAAAGAPVSLAFTFSQANMNTGEIVIQRDAAGSSPVVANACALIVYPGGVVLLANDAGGYTNPNLYPGQSWTGSRENSQCLVDGPASSPVSAVAGGITVTLRLTFKASWAGQALRIFLRSSDTSYVYGSWQQAGTFAVGGSSPPPPPPPPPGGNSVSPSAGSAAADVLTDLTFTISQTSHRTTEVVLQPDTAGASPVLANSCSLIVYTSGPAQFANDGGQFANVNLYLGYSWAGTQENSQCIIDGPGSGLPGATATGATFRLRLKFKAAWAGRSLTIFARSSNTTYAYTSWAQLGTFTVSGSAPPPPPPPSNGLSPNPGLSAVDQLTNVAFAISQTNPLKAEIVIQPDTAGTTPLTANACALIVHGSGPVQLANDAGQFPNPFIYIGYSWGGSQENTQCFLDGPGSTLVTATTSGLSFTLRLRFKAAWTGRTLRVFTRSTNTGYVNTAWAQIGTWTVSGSAPPPPPPPTPSGHTVTPSAGVAAVDAFTTLAFGISQTSPYTADIVIQPDTAGTTPAFANACAMTVHATGVLLLADNAGLFTNGNLYPGQSWTGTRENSQCFLDGPGSSGITATSAGFSFSLRLKFKPAWAGRTLRIFARSTNTSYQAGAYQQIGTFVVQ